MSCGCARCGTKRPARRTAPPAVHAVLRQGGERLPDAIRQQAEAHFGFDLGAVRIHRDQAAGRAALAVGASAWTVGRHIAFAPGAWSPGSAAGERLILHELAHAAQQRLAAPPSGEIAIGGAGDAQEREADQSSAPRGTDAPTLRRQPVLSAREEQMVKTLHAELGLAPPRTRPEGIVWLGDRALVSPQLREGAELAAGAVREGRTPEFAYPAPGMLELQARLAKDRPGLVPAPSRKPALKPKPRPLSETLPPSWTAFQRKAFVEKLRPVQDETGTTVGFLEWRSGVLHVVDLEGVSVRTLAEKGLETPLIDPIDLIPGEIVAKLSARFGAAALKGGARLVRGAAVKETEKLAAAEAERLLLQQGGEALAREGVGLADDAGETALRALKGADEAAIGAVPAAPKPPRPSDPAQRLMDRHPGRLADPDGALAETFRRAADPANAKLRRAAAAEVKEIERVLTQGLDGKAVTQLEVVKPSSAGRTPDFIATFADGTTARLELRTLTSAPGRLTLPQAGAALAGETTRRLPTVQDIGRAILDKVKSTPARPNQLAAPIAGVAPGGSVSVSLAAGSAPTRAALDAEIGRIAGRLPPELRSVTIHWMERAPSGALKSAGATYARDASGIWVRTAWRVAQ